MVWYPFRRNEFVPKKGRGVVELTEDELEAIRLSFIERRKQEDAALVMGVSQPTFSRILSNALKKVADALVFGKRIRTEIRASVLTKIYKCNSCSFIWVPPLGYIPEECPKCGSENIKEVSL